MKKLILLLLSLAMLFSLAACKGDGEDPANTTPPTVTNPQEEETSDPNDRDDLGSDISLGREINIVDRVEVANVNELDPVGEEGEIVNDAVFNRNAMVEQRLNCTIKITQLIGSATAQDMDQIPQQVRSMVNNGSTDFDIVANASYTTVPLGFQGYLCNLQETEKINLQKNYWSDGYNEALSHGDAQYCVTGPMSLSYYRYMFITLFNKQLIAAQGLENMYDVVNRGDWTMEYLQEKAALFYENLNADPERDFGDRFGYCVRIGHTSSMLDGYWEGTGISVLQKTADNRLTYSINNDLVHSSVDALLDLLDSDGVICGGETDEDILRKFTSNESAFITYRLLSVESGEMKSMVNEYGILPMPKLTAEQEYSNNIQVEILLYAIPYSCYGDLDNIAAFLECLGSESYAYVKPAYCERALTGRYFKDPESVAMFDLIVKSVAVDPLNIYTRSFLFSCESVRQIHENGTNTVLNMIGSYADNTRTAVEKLNESYDDTLLYQTGEK